MASIYNLNEVNFKDLKEGDIVIAQNEYLIFNGNNLIEFEKIFFDKISLFPVLPTQFNLDKFPINYWDKLKTCFQPEMRTCSYDKLKTCSLDFINYIWSGSIIKNNLVINQDVIIYERIDYDKFSILLPKVIYFDLGITLDHKQLFNYLRDFNRFEILENSLNNDEIVLLNYLLKFINIENKIIENIEQYKTLLIFSKLIYLLKNNVNILVYVNNQNNHIYLNLNYLEIIFPDESNDVDDITEDISRL